jgi:hypothetical protein
MLDDGSDVSLSRSFAHGFLLEGIPVLGYQLPPFHPASGVDG